MWWDCGSWASQVALVKNPPANAGDVRDTGLIHGTGRSHGGGRGNPLQYSYPENPMDRGAWWATVHGVTKNRTWLSDFTFTFTPWKENYEQPRQLIKKQKHYFVNKGQFSKAMVFPVVIYGSERWTVTKKAEHWRTDAFELRCWRRLLRVPWTARDPTSPS